MLRARLVLLVGLGAAVACNSDDTGAVVEPTTGSSSTGEPGSSSTGTPTSTGDASSSSSSSTGDPTTGGSSTGAPEQSCRDVLMCFASCAVSLDPACFQACAGNLPPEEGMKALALGSCVVQTCFMTMACTVDTLQDPLCLACIGLGLISESFEGCEEQGAACT
jgi:hypothetical protein